MSFGSYLCGLNYHNGRSITHGRFTLRWADSKQATSKLRAGSHYAQIESRSVTFPDQTMSRGEAYGLKKYIKNNRPLKKVRPLDGSLDRAFCSTQTWLERLNSWPHNFLKVLPPRLFWRRCHVDF